MIGTVRSYFELLLLIISNFSASGSATTIWIILALIAALGAFYYYRKRMSQQAEQDFVQEFPEQLGEEEYKDEEEQFRTGPPVLYDRYPAPSGQEFYDEEIEYDFAAAYQKQDQYGYPQETGRQQYDQYRQFGYGADDYNVPPFQQYDYEQQDYSQQLQGRRGYEEQTGYDQQGYEQSESYSQQVPYERSSTGFRREQSRNQAPRLPLHRRPPERY